MRALDHSGHSTHFIIPSTAIMKPLLYSLGIVAFGSLAHAANLANALGPTISTPQTVDGTGALSDYFQMGAGGLTHPTITIANGGQLNLFAPEFETIIGQNVASSTWTLNIETGGQLNSGTAGNQNFFVGNNLITTTGIINLNGGVFNGLTFTSFRLGRDNGNGIFNISAGTANIGVAPIIDRNAGNSANGTGTSYFNFTTGSTGTLAITGYDATSYETLFNNGDLRYGGSVGTAGTFGDFFEVNGNTLSVIPEPSAALLGGFGVLALLRRRRA